MSSRVKYLRRSTRLCNPKPSVATASGSLTAPHQWQIELIEFCFKILKFIPILPDALIAIFADMISNETTSFCMECIWNRFISILPHPFLGKWIKMVELDGPTVGGSQRREPQNNFSFKKVCWSRNRRLSYGFTPYSACAKLYTFPMVFACP